MVAQHFGCQLAHDAEVVRSKAIAYLAVVFAEGLDLSLLVLRQRKQAVVKLRLDCFNAGSLPVALRIAQKIMPVLAAGDRSGPSVCDKFGTHYENFMLCYVQLQGCLRAGASKRTR